MDPSSTLLHGPHHNLLIVIRETPTLVSPAYPTPHRVFHLPRINAFTGFGSITNSRILLFEPSADLVDENPAHVLRQALEKVLVPYYPFAGRLRSTQHGNLEVVCDGKGAVFVDATANITLAELKKLDKTYWWAELQYNVYPDDSSDVPPLVVQVTRLACGGFVLSVRLTYSLCDTPGIVQFLRGWSEIARGKQSVSILPIWGKEIPRLPISPPRFHFPSLELVHSQETLTCRHEKQYIEWQDLDPMIRIPVTFDDLAALRELLVKEGIHKCNSFEALAAHVWRARTRVLGIPLAKEVRLFCLAPVNYEVQDYLPIAFHGQYAFNCQAITTAGELLQRPLSYAVHLIQRAKASIEDNFAKCAADFADLHCPAAGAPHNILVFTVLSKDISDIDFGWGKPNYAADALRIPSPLNVAAVTPPLEESRLHIMMSNIPLTSVENLKFHIHNIQSFSSKIDSNL